MMEGEPKIFDNGVGPTILIENGFVERTAGLDNAVYFSLFCPDWWGNDIATETHEKTDSEIEEIMRENLTAQSILNFEEFVKNKLSWLKEDSIVKDFQIETELHDYETLYLLIIFSEPDTEIKYKLNWSEMRAETV